MKEAKKYLQAKSVISDGDVVFIGLKELLDYTKVVQMESILEFIEDNHPEAHGMINTLRFQIREIMNTFKVEEEHNPFDE